jgi:plastocyanin
LFLATCTISPEEDSSGEIDTDTSWYIPDSSVLAKLKVSVDTIEIAEMKFHPSILNVKKGDTVLWINNDLVTHCITEETSKAWTSSQIPGGSSWKMVITQNTNYFCAIHQVMRGQIVIE